MAISFCTFTALWLERHASTGARTTTRACSVRIGFQEKDSGGACHNKRHAKTMRAGGSIVKQYLIRPNLNQAGGPSRSEGVDALRSLRNESGKTYGRRGSLECLCNPFSM